MLFDHRRQYYRLPVTDEMRRLAATITAAAFPVPRSSRAYQQIARMLVKKDRKVEVGDWKLDI